MPQTEAQARIAELLEMEARMSSEPWERVADAVREPRWTHIKDVQTTAGRMMVADVDGLIALRNNAKAMLDIADKAIAFLNAWDKGQKFGGEIKDLRAAISKLQRPETTK